MKLANLTSNYRAELILNAYKNWLKEGVKVLDVGCGTGVVSKKLSEHYSIDLTGCDIENYLITDINFVEMNRPNQLPFKNGSFNVVIFNDVLHHIQYPVQKKLLQEALRVSDTVLLFELIQTPVGKFFDWLLNKIHNPNMQIPYTYNSIKEWKIIFDKLAAKHELRKVKKPLFYPFHHIAFKLCKNE